MKNFRTGFLYRIYLSTSIILCTSLSLHAAIRFTSNDPYPVFTAQNPLAWYTFWHDCEPESPYDFSISLFRQVAHKGRRGPFHVGTCPTNATAACAMPNCQPCCDKDVPIGDIHGPWNIIALLYPEANGNTTIGDNIIVDLNLTDGTTYNVTNPAEDLAYISLPSNTDPAQQFGFLSVPIDYKKYGVRFQADLALLCNFGLRLQGGVVCIRQNRKFIDLTCCAPSYICQVTSPPTGSVTSCSPGMPNTACTSSATCCSINTYTCDMKNLVINGMTKEPQREAIAQLLGLNIDNFEKTNVEDLIFSLYWTRCWEFNTNTDNPCWPDYTFAPFAVAEISAPMSKSQNLNHVFSVPFGLDRHWGYGFTAGFTLNFIETIELGFDAGFSRYSEERFCDYPVPTNWLQQGIFPRKAVLDKRPGTTWSFGATMGAYHFLSCLSAYVQFRLVNHDEDTFCIIEPIPVTPLALAGTTPLPDNFVTSNILVDKMRQESMWTSSFVDVSLDYDISEDMQLGFFWQAPVTQQFAYRPTTVMGSLIFKF